MLLHKNGRFTVGNLSFELPNKMMLIKFTDDNRFELKTVDDAVLCVLSFSSNFTDAEELLRDSVDTYDAAEMHIHSPVQPIKLGNVEGYHARYDVHHPARKHVTPVRLIDEHAFTIHDGAQTMVFEVYFIALPTADLEQFNNIIADFIRKMLLVNQ